MLVLLVQNKGIVFASHSFLTTIQLGHADVVIGALSGDLNFVGGHVLVHFNFLEPDRRVVLLARAWP